MGFPKKSRKMEAKDKGLTKWNHRRKGLTKNRKKRVLRKTLVQVCMMKQELENTRKSLASQAPADMWCQNLDEGHLEHPVMVTADDFLCMGEDWPLFEGLDRDIAENSLFELHGTLLESHLWYHG